MYLCSNFFMSALNWIRSRFQNGNGPRTLCVLTTSDPLDEISSSLSVLFLDQFYVITRYPNRSDPNEHAFFYPYYIGTDRGADHDVIDMLSCYVIMCTEGLFVAVLERTEMAPRSVHRILGCGSFFGLIKGKKNCRVHLRIGNRMNTMS